MGLQSRSRDYGPFHGILYKGRHQVGHSLLTTAGDPLLKRISGVKSDAHLHPSAH